MWYKLFDWLRLMHKTAIYPILLQEVLIDIFPFLRTMFIVLCLFGNGLYILSSIVVYEGNPELYPELMSKKIASAFMMNLLTMTGASQTESYFIRD